MCQMPLRNAPITTLIDERADGVHLSYDRTASVPAPFGSAEALKVRRIWTPRSKCCYQQRLRNMSSDLGRAGEQIVLSNSVVFEVIGHDRFELAPEGGQTSWIRRRQKLDELDQGTTGAFGHPAIVLRA
jgi:hypothetical protein